VPASSATRRHVLLTGLALAATASPLALVARLAMAQDLASAKRDGLLGERIDGFVGVVTADAPANIRALADDINGRRRQEYARIAEREGIAVEAVAQLAGEKLIDRAGRGEWIVGADGRWRQK
jgi:uncharacterized protein YdbL (DUF1318 family)